MIARLPQPASSPRRALALIRVSRERDGTTSPDVQRYAIQTYADANRITIVDWVEGVDEAKYSGSRSKSAWWPKLSTAIDRVEAGEADDILVWKFSRTARNRLKWAIAIDRIDALRGNIISATEPIDGKSASGRFARGMLGEMNAYQADLIGEGWKETHQRRVRQGKPATGRPRFGYIRDQEADSYTPDPETAPIVAELYSRSLAGHGMAALARWLNDQGQRTRNDQLWQTAGVTRYLDRGFAAGLIYAHGELLPGAHEPIIDGETWDAYRARRARNTKGPRGSVRMASGLVRCACGATMMMGRSTGGSGAYSCSRRARGDAGCPYRYSIERHLVENHLTRWVADLPQRLELLREAEQRAARDRTRTIEDRAAIGRLIARAETRLAALTMKLVDGKITQGAYDATAAQLNDELSTLRARHTRSAPLPAAHIYGRIPALVEGWDQMSPAAQNRVARTLIDRIDIQPAARQDSGQWRERVQIVPKWETTSK